MKINSLFACLLAVCSASKSFDSFKVFRLMPSTREQLNYLLDLERDDPSLDFWKGVNNVGNPVDVMVKPEQQLEFVAKIKNIEIPAEVMIDDVQEYVVFL